jgi:hypothetical protein
VADQAKLSDAAKVPDKRPPPRLDTLGLDSELAVRNRQICTATDKSLIETSVLDGFRRLQVRSLAPKVSTERTLRKLSPIERRCLPEQRASAESSKYHHSPIQFEFDRLLELPSGKRATVVRLNITVTNSGGFWASV